jgi:hypothetical protein
MGEVVMVVWAALINDHLASVKRFAFLLAAIATLPKCCSFMRNSYFISEL